MMLKRRWPRATSPCTEKPDPSGPRWAMMSVMLRMTRASARVPSVWRTPAMPHIRLVLPDCYRLEARLQERLGSDSMCFRRPVDGPLLLGQESQGRHQACQNRQIGVVTQAGKKRHRQKNDKCGAQGQRHLPEVPPVLVSIPRPNDRIQHLEDPDQQYYKDD